MKYSWWFILHIRKSVKHKKGIVSNQKKFVFISLELFLVLEILYELEGQGASPPSSSSFGPPRPWHPTEGVFSLLSFFTIGDFVGFVVLFIRLVFFQFSLQRGYYCHLQMILFYQVGLASCLDNLYFNILLILWEIEMSFLWQMYTQTHRAQWDPLIQL